MNGDILWGKELLQPPKMILLGLVTYGKSENAHKWIFWDRRSTFFVIMDGTEAQNSFNVGLSQLELRKQHRRHPDIGFERHGDQEESIHAPCTTVSFSNIEHYWTSSISLSFLSFFYYDLYKEKMVRTG